MTWRILFLFTLVSLKSQANVIVENFTSQQQKNSSTAIWNQALGVIHPTLLVKDFQAPAGPVTSLAFDVGDGIDGAFDSTTYSNFGSVAGFLITIDALVHPVLNVTKFQLDTGYTLKTINGPLVIHSLSSVIIDGVIDCNGQDGFPAVAAIGGNPGLGKCAGLNGGRGGNASQSGFSGAPTVGLVSGGGGGIFSSVAAPGSGGGGGGAYAGNPGGSGLNSTPANNAGGSGGNGAAGADHQFSIISGSPGGGGGSGSSTQGGGGGGAGGGIIIIHAVGDVIINATGAILALGGNGGAANSGGGGGGGGGGSVKIFTPANLHLDSGTPINVSNGVGSIPTVANAGDGGLGSYGRTWDISATFTGLGSESHASGLLQLGTPEFSIGSPQYAVSKSYDTQFSLSSFKSISANTLSPDVNFEVAGSDDNFVSSDSGWISAASITTLQKKRYVKFKLILTNSNAATPTQVSDVYINYDLGILEEFQFKSAGCGRIQNESTSTKKFFLLVLLLLMPLLIAIKLKTIKTKK